MNFDAIIPIRTVSEPNQSRHEHWATKKRRVDTQRKATRAVCFELRPAEGELEVQLTRISPRQLDTDNLAGSMKAIRDEIAALLGRDDNPDAGIEWIYDQRRGKPKQYAVAVAVRAR